MNIQLSREDIEKLIKQYDFALEEYFQAKKNYWRSCSDIDDETAYNNANSKLESLWRFAQFLKTGDVSEITNIIWDYLDNKPNPFNELLEKFNG